MNPIQRENKNKNEKNLDFSLPPSSAAPKILNFRLNINSPRHATLAVIK